MDVTTPASQIRERNGFPEFWRDNPPNSDLWRSLLAALDQVQLSSKTPTYRMLESPLGEELFVCSASTDSQESSGLYVVCHGRVRLLCNPVGQTKAVTALLLEEGHSFGGETWLKVDSLDYRAVSASDVRVAHIPAASLQILVERFPNWYGLLQQQARERERMVFLRSVADVRSLPSRQIQSFLPDWVERSISAGTSLSEATPASEGRYWLRQGQIGSRDGNAQSTEVNPPAPTLGQSWGHPDPVPFQWIAQTDLVVYQLPPEQWENLSLLQTATANEESLPASTQTPSPGIANGAVPTKRTAPVLPIPPIVSQQTSPSSGSQSDASPEPVAFPKPLKQQLLGWFNRYPWTEQQSSSDCGAACLAMITRFWGKQFPIHKLRELANVGRSGASLKSLAKAAESLGFHTRPVRASLSRMVDQPNPWIAHWDGNHYVVVYRFKGNQVIISDPALGQRTLSRKAFQSHWTGYALLLEPTEQFRSVEAQSVSLNRYLSALLPYRTVVLQIILVSLLIQVFGLVSPLFTQIILDRVVVQKSQTTLNAFVLGLFLFGIWGIAMSSVRDYLLSYFSNRLDITLVSGFIRYALMLPLKFFESRRVGDILTRVQENQKIQRFLIGQVVLAWLNFLTGFVYLGLMLHYNWKLTVLVMLLIPPILLLTLGATPFLRQMSREIFHEAAEQNSALVEMMTGVSTVKMAAAEQELRWRWEDCLTSQMNAVFKGQRLGIGLSMASGLINSIGGTILLWYGATLVIQGELTIGQFVAFNMMVGFVISPVVALASLWDELQEVLISVERLNDVFETKPEESSQSSLLVLPRLQGEVVFENMTFRYGGDEDLNILQNLSFEVSPGQTIAIVGRSGSGKTTLVKLIEGLYFANSGRVLVDGQDVRHVSLRSLRSQMGVVPQECFLFSGTILENITLYRTDFSLEQVIEASRLAEAHAFIQSLPLGYNTMVGERGSTLSGGQRQRIAIARALLGNPRILILDEATSSLDTESERRFQRNLMQISRDRTTFIIAHRLSTVRNADCILVLDKGVLVEQGTHQELMNAQGLYYHLAQQQLDL